MPTLTTQSIGIATVPLTAGYHAGSIAQSTKSASDAEVQRSQNQARAISDAEKAKSGKDRAVQEEKRVEGLFECQGDEPTQQESGKEHPEQPGTAPYFRIA